MPRPRKGRRICCLPRVNVFGPMNSTPEGEIRMTVEEYEAIRLLDLERLTQEEAAERMRVARTTVQRIYAAAREKVAEALFAGSVLRIEGGDYEFYPKANRPAAAAVDAGRAGAKGMGMPRCRNGRGGGPGGARPATPLRRHTKERSPQRVFLRTGGPRPGPQPFVFTASGIHLLFFRR